MMTNIVDCDLDALTIGQTVQVVFKPPTDGGPPVPMFAAGLSRVTRRLFVVALGGLPACAHVAANAAPVETTGASQCRARGFATELDPVGTNVRSAPRADAPVIGRVAPRALLGPNT